MSARVVPRVQGDPKRRLDATLSRILLSVRSYNGRTARGPVGYTCSDLEARNR